MHLIIDGQDVDKKKLEDLELIYRILDKLPDEIRMTKIMPPYVFKYKGVEPLDWGISGFVLIAESHISIHTFPERGYVNIDIFSCKWFDTEIVISYLKNIFSLKDLTIKTIERGLEYIKNG
ncbi:MAG: adenosylmethionine decarboxylase [bacterium]|nr:adenosylmethionine decarboxylase [bacterium]